MTSKTAKNTHIDNNQKQIVNVFTHTCFYAHFKFAHTKSGVGTLENSPKSWNIGKSFYFCPRCKNVCIGKDKKICVDWWGDCSLLQINAWHEHECRVFILFSTFSIVWALTGTPLITSSCCGVFFWQPTAELAPRLLEICLKVALNLGGNLARDM